MARFHLKEGLPLCFETFDFKSWGAYATIKLGIDAHAKWYYVARQLDGATPQPVQKMDFDGLLHFVAKQQRLTREVVEGQDLGDDLKRGAGVGGGATEGFHQADRTGGGRGAEADRGDPEGGAGPQDSEGGGR